MQSPSRFDDIAAAMSPGHTRVLGLPASGKTSLMLARYRHLTARGLPASIITYSRDAVARVTQLLLADGEAWAGSTPVTTYYALARDILNAADVSTARQMSTIEEALLVRRIVGDNEREMTSDLKSIAMSERFQRDLLAMFHLLLQSAAPVIDGTGKRVRDVMMLYGSFVSALRELGAVTHYDVAPRAADAVDTLPATHVLRLPRHWLVDDFHDIDAGQYALLHALVPPAADSTLSVFGDPMGPYFGFRGTQGVYLTDHFVTDYKADTLYIERPTSQVALDDALAAIAGQVIGGDETARLSAPLVVNIADGALGPLFATAASDGGEAQTLAAEMVIVEDEMAEVYSAAATVRDWVVNGDFAPEDIAVITNDKNAYEPLLRAAFTQRGVPIATGRSVPGGMRDLARALLSLLVAPRELLLLQSLKASSLYPDLRATHLDGVIDNDETLQEFVRTTRQQFVALPAGERMPWLIHSILKPIADRYYEDSNDDAVYAFMPQLADGWVDFVAASEALGQAPELRSFTRLSGLFDVKMSPPRPNVEEVGLYTPREMRGRFFRATVVVGCSELLFPGAVRAASLLPLEELQAQYATRNVALAAAQTPQEHLHSEYHLLFHALTRARERLRVSAPLTFNGQKHPAPANLLRSLVATQDEREPVPPQIRFVERWVHEPPGSDIAGAVAEVTALGELFNQPALPGADFAIARFPLSKSSIESYARCPRQFFYRRVLRLDDDESAPLVVGNIFHGVMDAVGQAYPGTAHLPAALDAAFIEEQVDDALQAHKIAAASFYHSTLRRHLIDMVRGAIKLDIAKSDEYTVEETEAMFKFEHGGFEFSGRADRIDRVAGDLSLVDFKTGKEHKKGVTLRRKTLDVVDSPGEGNWQVPIYVWAYREQKGRLPASFRMLVQRPGETPFFVTLYIRDRMENVPESATSNKRDYQGFSYLLAEELEHIMARAVALSDDVFAERDRFMRTDNIKHCRNCTFSRLCGRDAA